MPTVLLVRHGRTAANSSGVLAGWTPGIGLDDHGRAQVEALGDRIASAGVTVSRVVSSPLQRCQETAAIVVAKAADGIPIEADDRLGRRATGRGPGGSCRSWPRRTSGGPSRTSRPRCASRTGTSSPVSRWRRCSPERWTPCGAWTPRSRRPMGLTRCGWRCRTATSSRRSWPTRRGHTSTSSSGSRWTPPRCPWSATPRGAPSCCAATTTAATWAGSSRHPPSPTEEATPEEPGPTEVDAGDAAVGGGAG